MAKSKDNAPVEPKKPFHEVVAEKLIAQLEQGTAPWQKPWNPGLPGAGMPMNPVTGKRYKGINAVHLLSEGRSDTRWLTFKQAKAAGASVRKGEKATHVQYWQFTRDVVKKEKDGTPVLDDKGKPVKETVKLERPDVFYAAVFNAEQIDGLPPAVAIEKKWDSQERAEQILAASGAKISHDQQDRAFYRMSTDSIHLPYKEAFESSERYYATALHELGHWTGHNSRLDRDLSHPFGSEGYAREELRAEIASMIMGDELGIGHDPSQHVAYVKSWIKALQEDPLEISRAAADAERIQTHILGLEQQLRQEQPLTLQVQQRHAEHKEVAEYLAKHPLTISTADNLEGVSAVAGYSSFYSWDNSDISSQSVRINYLDKEDSVLPVHSVINEQGKAASFIGDERVSGTTFTTDAGWQKDALKTAFASMKLNMSLAAKTLTGHLEKIEGDPRELPEGVKFPRNWIPNASFLASNQTSSQSERGAGMKEQSEPVIAAADQRRYRAEKFVLSNLGESLHNYLAKMDRSQLKLTRDVLAEAAESSPESEFWTRNSDHAASFNQDWSGAGKIIGQALKDVELEINLLPQQKYLVVSESGDGSVPTVALETNSATRAYEAAILFADRKIQDTRQYDMTPVYIDLKHREGSFFETLDVEKEAVAKGIISLEDNVNVLPPQEAWEWYSSTLSNSLENAYTPEEINEVLNSLGNDPAGLEPVYLSDKGSRIYPDEQQTIAQEDTLLDVSYADKAQAKALGAKWDREEHSWYVPAGMALDNFAKWDKNRSAEGEQPEQPERNAAVTTSEVPTPLAVPYEERGEAKAAGAVWDKEHKFWYAEAGADLAPFEKWRLENVSVTQKPVVSLNDEVSEALKSIGCIMDADEHKGRRHPILTGEKVRITVEGDQPGQKSGFYFIHTDGNPAGFMQNNRTGEELRWCSKGYVQDSQQSAALRAKAAEQRLQRDAELTRTHESTAQRVDRQAKSMVSPQTPTAYLEKKGLQVHDGILTDREGVKTCIPAYDIDGKQWTMQYINEDGTKRFAKNGKKEGCFHVVGGLEALRDAPVLIISEGYATAGSITEATNIPTVAAFDNGNLLTVAEALHKRFPDKPVIIAGDDDLAHACKMKPKSGDPINVGREKALAAAEAVGGVAIFPVFASGEVPDRQELKQITPDAYKTHQAAMRQLELHASGEKQLSKSEIKLMEAARLSEKQMEILKRAERHTDFNDLDRNSSLGRQGVANQINAVISRQLEQRNQHTQQQQEKLIQVKEKKRTVRHSL